MIPFLLLAQVAADPLADLLPLAQALLAAVVHGDGWAIVSALLTGTGLAVKRLGGRLWAPLGTWWGSGLAVVLLAFAGGIVNALAAGAVLGADVLQTAAGIAVAAAVSSGLLDLALRRLAARVTPGVAS